MTPTIRTALAGLCSVALAASLGACGGSESSGSKVSTVTESVKTVIEKQQEQNGDQDNQNQDNGNQDNGNESVSKQKAECLAHNKGYPQNCADIP